MRREALVVISEVASLAVRDTPQQTGRQFRV